MLADQASAIRAARRLRQRDGRPGAEDLVERGMVDLDDEPRLAEDRIGARELRVAGLERGPVSSSPVVTRRSHREVAATLDGAIGIGCEVSDLESVQALCRRAQDEVGAVDILVNNRASQAVVRSGSSYRR